MMTKAFSPRFLTKKDKEAAAILEMMKLSMRPVRRTSSGGKRYRLKL